MANIKRLVEYSMNEPARIFLISLLAITFPLLTNRYLAMPSRVCLKNSILI